MTVDVDAAVAALRRGDVVGMPTDTVYGLAVGVDSAAGLRQLDELKGRPLEQPIAVLVASIGAATGIGVFTTEATALAESHWPGPLTLVVARHHAAPPWLGDTNAGTIGVRVPDHATALLLLAAAGPLAVTSANRSGLPAAADDAAARADFGDAVTVYVAGAGAGGAASTVVDVTRSPAVLLRSGPVPWPDDG